MNSQSRKRTLNYSLASRDEMNLAEFPLTVLSTRVDPKVKTLEFSDEIRGKNGEIVNRTWIITAADKFGLPTASDDEVLLGLLKLTVDDGFQDRKVFFTRYELLKILRWTTEGRSYSRLQKALDRLSGVRIKATNAFYDNATKSHSTVNFGIIDAYEINDGRDSSLRETRSSFFIWSEALFNSFQAGFIKKLDLEFYLTLKSAVSKRLYRYLDKHFWYKSKVQTNLFVLAHEKLGISRNYRYASSLRQQLDTAIEELTALGFIAGCSYEGRGQGTNVSFFSGMGKHDLKTKLEANSTSSTTTVEEIESAVKSEFDSDSKKTEGLAIDDLLENLIARGIVRAQAKRLVCNLTKPQWRKANAIVAYFDELVASKSKLITRSPAGFLFKAIQRIDDFVLPQSKTTQKPPQTEYRAKPDKADSQDREMQYLVEKRKEVNKIKGEVEPSLLDKIRKDVEQAWSKVRGSISPDKFTEAVELGVEEKLLKLYAFPDFSDWVQGRG